MPEPSDIATCQRLLEISLEAQAADDTESALRLVLQGAIELTAAGAAGFAERRDERLEQVALRRAPDGPPPAVAQAAFSRLLLARSWHPDQAPVHFGAAELPATRGAIGLSLPAADGRCDGVVAVLDKTKGEFTAADAATLSALARIAAAALRRLAERAEAAAIERGLRGALSGADEGLWEWDIAGGRLALSDCCARIMRLPPGRGPGPWTVEEWQFTVHPDDRESLVEVLDAFRRGARDSFDEQYRILGDRGDWVWVRDRGRIVERGPQGRPRRAFGTLTELTEQKRAEERLRYALEGSNDGLWDWDIRGARAYHSPRYRAILGYAADESMGPHGSWIDNVHPDDAPVAQAKLAAMLSGESAAYSAEYRIRSRSNDWIWVLDRGKVVERDEAGCAVRAVGMLSDMTHLKREERRYRYVLEASNDALWDWDVVGGDIYRNDRYFALRGYAPGELPSTYESWEEAVHPDDLAEVLQRLAAHFDGRSPALDAEYRLRTKSGGWVWVSERAKVVERDADGRPLRMVGAQMDVTERRETEQELRAQGERLSAALAASRTGTYRWEVATGRLTRDENMSRLIGHPIGPSPASAGKYIEGSLAQFYDRVHPDDRERVQAATEQCVGNCEDLQIDYRIVLPNGAVRWIAENGKMFCDLAGRPLYMTGACTDITDRKVAEEELAQSRDRAEAANRAKSEFLANMSHELRTPLNAVIGFSDAMLNGYAGALTPKQVEYASDINASGQHLLAIVNDVLDLSKVEAGKLELFCERVILSDAISVCVGLMQTRADAGGLALEVGLPATPLAVWADELRLRQILLNVLSNAVKFTPAGGTVRIGAAPAEDMVKVSVSDTGIGMKPTDVALALLPFSQVDGSLARRFQGTGLGLPLVKLLTEMHGGTLDIDTSPGAGTTVTILLPCRRPQVQGRAA